MDGFYGLFAQIVVLGFCRNSERDATATDDCANKYVDGGVCTHSKLFAELVKFCFLSGVQTDGHCGLCHNV